MSDAGPCQVKGCTFEETVPFANGPMCKLHIALFRWIVMGDGDIDDRLAEYQRVAFMPADEMLTELSTPLWLARLRPHGDR